MDEGREGSSVLAAASFLGVVLYLAALGIAAEQADPWVVLAMATVVPLGIAGVAVARWRLLPVALLGSVLAIAAAIIAMRLEISWLLLAVLVFLPAATTFVVSLKSGRPRAGGTAVVGLWSIGTIGVFCVIAEYPAIRSEELGSPRSSVAPWHSSPHSSVPSSPCLPPRAARSGNVTRPGIARNPLTSDGCRGLSEALRSDGDHAQGLATSTRADEAPRMRTHVIQAPR